MSGTKKIEQNIDENIYLDFKNLVNSVEEIVNN